MKITKPDATHEVATLLRGTAAEGVATYDPIGRRLFLGQIGLGFYGSAIGYLWAEDGLLSHPIQTKYPARAKSVIFLFMCGGVSHIDTFDPKDKKWEGSMVDNAIGFGDNQAPMRRPVIPCLRTFRRYGQSGLPVSDWFPHIGGVIDEIAVIRSMFTHEVNHFPAAIELATGHRPRQFDYPSLGAWVSYALGSANRNLPTFVNIGRPSSPVQIDGGFLGANDSATPFQTGLHPLANLELPRGVTRSERERQLESLAKLNREFRERYVRDRDIAARLQNYELAARLQLSAPEALDFSQEPQSVLKLYGIGEKETESYGRQLLLARRLAERGVRFIQVCHGGRGNGRWDAHGDMAMHAPLCRQTDKPIAGLIRDLKLHGMLEDTLVVWATEFGRTPWSQNTMGRDHNPRGFTCWLAGGGVKGGMAHGRTDDLGYHAVEDRHYVTDLQATIVRQMGLDYLDLEVEIEGQPLRLVDEGLGPILPILS